MEVASVASDYCSSKSCIPWRSPEKPRSKASSYAAEAEDYPSRCSTPWASPEKRNRSRRFHTEELNCFRRLPTPSPLYAQKAESYWQLQGGLRRVFSDSGLHILPVAKGDFWHAGEDEPCVTDADLPSDLGVTYFPLEDRTALVLDQLFPRSPMGDALDREAARHSSGDGRDRGCVRRCHIGHAAEASSSSSQSKKLEIPTNTRQGRFLHLRQKLLEKFNTIKNAFDIFLQESGDYKKELSFKEFARFLGKHFSGLSREEQEQIFEFLDADKNGGVSLSEFHIAVEASAQVRNMDDLRRRWIALGFPSMRQALTVMEKSLDKNSFVKPSGQRLAFAEFAAALCRVGICTDEEHHAIFSALSEITGCCTVSLDELTSALASVSPSILLEDIRDRLLKGHGSLHNAFEALDGDDNGKLTYHEFVQRAAHEFQMSVHEAAKAFELIDIDGNHWISLAEFVSALRLSEPGLFLEEVRRKVRQRFRCICEAFAFEEQDVEKFAHKNDGQEQLNTRQFRRSSMFHKDTERKTCSDVYNVLSSLQFLEPETQLLFHMIDINNEGRLTFIEFVRGIRLFAPSCVLEDLRSRCDAKHDCVRDAFRDFQNMSPKRDRSPNFDKSPKNHRADRLYDKKQLRKLLEELQLADGINVDSVFDLVESRHDGGLHINELIVALQSSAPGVQVPLPPELRDARARQQVRWHMAPFHRSVSELRHEVRQKPIELTEECERRMSPSPTSKLHGASRSIFEQRKHVKSLPSLTTVSPQKSIHTASGPSQSPMKNAIGDSPLSSGSPGADLGARIFAKGKHSSSVTHHPTKRSYKKISQYLQSMPCEIDGQNDAILERITEYYEHAGDTLGHDWQLLKSPQRRLTPFEKQRPLTRS